MLQPGEQPGCHVKRLTSVLEFLDNLLGSAASEYIRSEASKSTDKDTCVHVCLYVYKVELKKWRHEEHNYFGIIFKFSHICKKE